MILAGPSGLAFDRRPNGASRRRNAGGPAPNQALSKGRLTVKMTLLAAGFAALLASQASAETIGVSMQSFDDNFQTLLRNGISARASQLDGVEVQLEDSQRDVGKQISQHAARGIKQLLCRHRGTVQLGFDRVDDFLVTPSQTQEPVATKTIEVGASESVGKGSAAAAPFHRGEVAALGYRFAVLEKSWVIVIGKVPQSQRNQLFRLRT